MGPVAAVFFHQAEVAERRVVLPVEELHQPQVVVGGVIVVARQVLHFIEAALGFAELLLHEIGVALLEGHFALRLGGELVGGHQVEEGHRPLVLLVVVVVIGHLDQAGVGQRIGLVPADKIQHQLLPFGQPAPHGGRRVAELRPRAQLLKLRLVDRPAALQHAPVAFHGPPV